MIDQILVLHKRGVSIRKIAHALNISRNTVRGYIRAENEPSRDKPISESVESVKDSQGFAWDQAVILRKKGVTVKQIYAEMEPSISYSRFCYRLREQMEELPKPTLRLDHEPGERVQIDFADGIPITDSLSGRTLKTQFFCAVLPFSSYTFGEFLPDQKLKNFIQVHERMWAYFGGVTPYVVFFYLKAGVKKAHRYDPEFNPTNCDYGNHTGFAGLAARPYTPRDKACIEATIGAIQRSFYQQVRDQSFYSLDELNRCFREFLQTFNHSLMKDYSVSRAERYSFMLLNDAAIVSGN